MKKANLILNYILNFMPRNTASNLVYDNIYSSNLNKEYLTYNTVSFSGAYFL